MFADIQILLEVLVDELENEVQLLVFRLVNDLAKAVYLKYIF
jgi:hypothetical protein